METFFMLLAICVGKSPVTGEFPAQRPVTRSLDVFFDLRLNKRLNKQSWGWWCQMSLCSLWRHCNAQAYSSYLPQGRYGIIQQWHLPERKKMIVWQNMKSEYFRILRLWPWLLMPWLLVSPYHQHHGIKYVGQTSPFLPSPKISTTCAISAHWEKREKNQYIFKFLKINSALKWLSTSLGTYQYMNLNMSTIIQNIWVIWF